MTTQLLNKIKEMYPFLDGSRKDILKHICAEHPYTCRIDWSAENIDPKSIIEYDDYIVFVINVVEDFRSGPIVTVVYSKQLESMLYQYPGQMMSCYSSGTLYLWNKKDTDSFWLYLVSGKEKQRYKLSINNFTEDPAELLGSFYGQEIGKKIVDAVDTGLKLFV